MSAMSEEIFQNQAVAKLLAGPTIHKAFQDCLLYIREYIPSDFLSLHLFDPGLGLFETVVDATPESSLPVSKKTVIPAEIRELVRDSVNRLSSDFPCLIIDCLNEFPMGKQLGMDLKTPDSACMVLRLVFDGKYLGSAALTPLDTTIRYTLEHARLFTLLQKAMALVSINYLHNRECIRLKEILADKNDFLQSELLLGTRQEVVGAYFGLKDVMEACEQVASSDTPVLLLGETGVGKEVVAGAIHRLSARRSGPFVKVNCGGIPATLLESSLFGHSKGAFTGALKDKKGYFERAEGGTIFLDEIGELSPDAQTRFLHVLQDKTFERVGGGAIRTADVRILAATHRNLEALADKGTFRRDLLFRLNVFPITIPPLRRRKIDIPPLAAHFIRKISGDMGLAELPKAAPGAVDKLLEYDWPGNVRELANVIEREIIIRKDSPLTFESIIPPGYGADEQSDSNDLNLDKAVSRQIIRALRRSKGVVEGPGGAAELLGLNPRTLQSRMRKLGIPFGRKAGQLYKE